MLGKGGSAKINQSMIDLETDFAFKRIKDREDPAGTWRANMFEVAVLQSPVISEHPNVSKLVGVCWEFDGESGDIWPVLVSEKAPYGDLRQFMDSDRGRTMMMKERICLCTDVAMAIIALHASSEYALKPLLGFAGTTLSKNRYCACRSKARKHTHLR